VTLARIGRFEVERPLGSGSFATVWLARDPDLEAWVAIKLLADNWSLNADARRRFLDEARALRRLDSDRIVRCHEVGHLPDGRPFMVMEFADRGTLEDRMRLRGQLDQPFSVEEAVELSVQIADCLIAVHDLRIVHRDVKPSNVLFRSIPAERREALRREGRAVAGERTLLGDFGIARRLEIGSAHTMVVGSPQYMAPEQADPASAGSVDERADLYSAAVILYELLAGRLPHGYATVTEVRNGPSSRSAGPPSLEALRPEVPAALAEAVMRSLSPDPAERIPDAIGWRSALAGSLRATPAAARAAPAATGNVVRFPPRPDHAGTAPAGTRRRTAVLASDGSSHPVAAPDPAPSTPVPAQEVRPIGQFPSNGRGPSTLSVRSAGAFLIVAAALLVASVALPWATTGDGAVRRLGGQFRTGAAVAGGAVALLLFGVRLWRTSRRWVAVLSATGSAAVGLGAVALASYELATVTSHVSGTLGGAPVTRGIGLVALLAGGLIAFAAAVRTIARIRDDRLRAKHPMLRRP
jgi:hypothetical protein